MHVKQLRVSLVHLHQDRVRRFPVVGDDFHVHLLVRRQVLCLLRGNVGLIEPPVLVPAHVLGVEHVLVVVLPGEIADAAFFVRRHRPVVRLPQRPHPHVQDSLHRRQVRQLRPIRRNLRRSLLRVPEQHIARDQRRGELLLAASRTPQNSRSRQNCQCSHCGNCTSPKSHESSFRPRHNIPFPQTVTSIVRISGKEKFRRLSTVARHDVNPLPPP